MYFDEINFEFCNNFSYFPNSFNSLLLKFDNDTIKVDNIKLLNLFSLSYSYKFTQQSFWLFCSMFNFEIFSIRGKIFSIYSSK